MRSGGKPFAGRVEFSSACRRCLLRDTVGPEMLQRCEYECRQAEALADSGRFVPCMQMDAADTVEYLSGGGSCRFPADAGFLENSVDTVLFRYFWVTGRLQEDDSFCPLDSALQIKIAAQANAPKRDRKPLLEVPVRCAGGKYGFSRFVFAGKCDRLAKALYRSRQAKRSFLCEASFFSPVFFKGRRRLDGTAYPSPLPSFQPEDYIYCELQTRCSFAVETCAALLEIPEEADQALCRRLLRGYYAAFFATPFILSRIFLMRQCIHEARLALENFPYSADYVRRCCDGNLTAQDLVAIRERAVLQAYESVLRPVFSMDTQRSGLPSEALCAASREELETCRRHLLDLLAGFRAPVDLVAHAAEQRSPLAFCNPRHPHVADILQELAQARTNSSTIQDYLNRTHSTKAENRWRGLLEAVYADIRAALPEGDVYMPVGGRLGE